MIYLHTTFHMPASCGSSGIAHTHTHIFRITFYKNISVTKFPHIPNIY